MQKPIKIHLPFPPTVNHIWQHSRNHVHRSPDYLRWIDQADQLFWTQKSGPIRMLKGPFIAILALHTTDKRKRKDADNRMKAPLDYATRTGLIEDDSLSVFGVSGWTTNPEIAPHGALLSIYEYQKEGLPEVAAALIAQFG